MKSKSGHTGGHRTGLCGRKIKGGFYSAFTLEKVGPSDSDDQRSSMSVKRNKCHSLDKGKTFEIFEDMDCRIF
jgi:hypothetical protein